MIAFANSPMLSFPRRREPITQLHWRHPCPPPTPPRCAGGGGARLRGNDTVVLAVLFAHEDAR